MAEQDCEKRTESHWRGDKCNDGLICSVFIIQGSDETPQKLTYAEMRLLSKDVEYFYDSYVQ